MLVLMGNTLISAKDAHSVVNGMKVHCEVAEEVTAEQYMKEVSLRTLATHGNRISVDDPEKFLQDLHLAGLLEFHYIQ